jgi:hypothetical protein
VNLITDVDNEVSQKMRRIQMVPWLKNIVGFSIRKL